MKHSAFAYAALALLGLAARAQDPQKEALKQKLKDTDASSYWIYDDINAGFAQAKKANKPMFVVFR